MIKSCYIHIPFCKDICAYCDFCKLKYHKKFINKYLDALEKEIHSTYHNEELETIYIGGGTPSILSLDELKRLFNIISVLKKSDKVEYTIEGNFESTTKEKLELYKEVGINRLSFGIESMNPNNLLFLQREEEPNKIEEVLKYARLLGFNNINLDLMYALPTENLFILENDINYLLSLDVEHISTYSLIIEDHTILKINNVKNIEQEKDLEMYELICKKLKENGFLHYEISNFAKAGFESKHNKTYWQNNEYYGFGVGASSYINNERINNTRSITKYCQNEFIKEKEVLSEKDKIEYEVILNLRMNTGIDLDLFLKKYNKELKEYYDYEQLIEDKLLCLNKNHLFIPENKWYISNEIIVRLLEREVYE